MQSPHWVDQILHAIKTEYLLTQSPMITSGIRLGTPACTTRGFRANEFSLIADLITKVVKGLSKNGSDNSKIEKKYKRDC